MVRIRVRVNPDTITLTQAYAVVLRPPIERTHSHMCEIGVNHTLWQAPRSRYPSVHLRDNYYVRASVHVVAHFISFQTLSISNPTTL